MADDLNIQNKLILLYVFDRMEIALTEETILDLCTSSNNWIPYMDCQQLLIELVHTNLVHPTASIHGRTMYSITPDGRTCLQYYYSRIPENLREIIADYVKKNRLKFRRKQEYYNHYTKNSDGTYTVILKISDVTQQLLEIKLIVSNRKDAKTICEKWENGASSAYANLLDLLLEWNIRYLYGGKKWNHTEPRAHAQDK